MSQKQMAFYTACNLASAAGRTQDGLNHMGRIIEDIHESQVALNTFKNRDDRAYTAIRTMRMHHAEGFDKDKNGNKRPRINERGADATWNQTKRFFAYIGGQDDFGAFVKHEKTREVLRYTAQVMRQYAAGEHPCQTNAKARPLQ